MGARGSSFLSLLSTGVRPGDPLPAKSYSVLSEGGQNKAPNLQADEIQGISKYFVLVIHDEDSHETSPYDSNDDSGLPEHPIMAISNIPVQQSLNLENPNGGEVVQTWLGPNPKDEFIHRIFFRLYELERELPSVTTWRELRDHILKSGVLDNEDASAELMMTAVTRLPSQP